MTSIHKNTLIVRNLAFEWKTTEDVESFFSQFGTVTECDVHRLSTGKPYATIWFQDSEVAETVARELNETKVFGRKISIAAKIIQRSPKEMEYLKDQVKDIMVEGAFSEGQSTVCDSDLSFVEEDTCEQPAIAV